MSSAGSSSSSSASSNQACAACKFQRRRCSSECPLARYFPAELNHRFMNCKRLFGVSNMVRFLKEVDPSDRDATMTSLMYEADVRQQDPVHGCYGMIRALRDELDKLRQELVATNQQLQFFQQQQQQQQTLAYAAAAAAAHQPLSQPQQHYAVVGPEEEAETGEVEHIPSSGEHISAASAGHISSFSGHIPSLPYHHTPGTRYEQQRYICFV